MPFSLLVTTAELDAADLRVIFRVSMRVEVLWDGKTGRTLGNAS